MKRWLAVLIAGFCLAWRLTAPSIPVDVDDPASWTDLAEAGDSVVAAAPTAAPTLLSDDSFVGLAPSHLIAVAAQGLAPEPRCQSPPDSVIAA